MVLVVAIVSVRAVRQHRRTSSHPNQPFYIFLSLDFVFRNENKNWYQINADIVCFLDLLNVHNELHRLILYFAINKKLFSKLPPPRHIYFE